MGADTTLNAYACKALLAYLKTNMKRRKLQSEMLLLDIKSWIVSMCWNESQLSL